MPVVFRHEGHTFFFYSHEGTPREPAHIHARRDSCEVKLWLCPEVHVAYNKITVQERSWSYRSKRFGEGLTLRGSGMNSLVEPMSVRFDEYSFRVELSDGRTLGIPIAWFPRLVAATPEQHNQLELSPFGLHWDAIDEDISIAGLLAGLGDQTKGRTVAA